MCGRKRMLHWMGGHKIKNEYIRGKIEVHIEEKMVKFTPKKIWACEKLNRRP